MSHSGLYIYTQFRPIWISYLFCDYSRFTILFLWPFCDNSRMWRQIIISLQLDISSWSMWDFTWSGDFPSELGLPFPPLKLKGQVWKKQKKERTCYFYFIFGFHQLSLKNIYILFNTITTFQRNINFVFSLVRSIKWFYFRRYVKVRFLPITTAPYKLHTAVFVSTIAIKADRKRHSVCTSKATIM